MYVSKINVFLQKKFSSYGFGSVIHLILSTLTTGIKESLATMRDDHSQFFHLNLSAVIFMKPYIVMYLLVIKHCHVWFVQCFWHCWVTKASNKCSQSLLSFAIVQILLLSCLKYLILFGLWSYKQVLYCRPSQAQANHFKDT